MLLYTHNRKKDITLNVCVYLPILVYLDSKWCYKCVQLDNTLIHNLKLLDNFLLNLMIWFPTVFLLF